MGAELLIASTALRAYRNRHLGTLMRCCEAWKPIENCFDTFSFECVDFQRPSQIIANLTCESLEEREAEITNLPWTQTEKDNAPARCRVGQLAWRAKRKKPSFVSMLSLMKTVIPWKTKMIQEEGFLSIGYENILRYVQKAADEIRWTIDHTEFDELIALKKDSAPGPDGTPHGAYKCAGGLGS